MAERPFFIVGYPRSGTTLLRFMLTSHRRLWIPDETGFIPFLRVPPDRPLSPVEVQRATNRIADLHHGWADVIRQTTDVGAGPAGPRVGDLLDALYRRRMRGSGAVRWGDKTPLYVLYMDRIADIFPDAQFVHLIRDGRDVAVSAAAKWGGRWPQRLYLDQHYVLHRWVAAVDRGRRFGATFGQGRYLELRYEDLVHEPEPSIRGVCDFLGEAFDPAMLRHERLARSEIAAGGHEEVWQPVSSARVGRWRRELAPAARRTAARVAGSTLQTLGYEAADARASAGAARLESLVLGCRYHLVRGIQRALETLGDAPLNRGRGRRGRVQA